MILQIAPRCECIYIVPCDVLAYYPGCIPILSPEVQNQPNPDYDNKAVSEEAVSVMTFTLLNIQVIKLVNEN